MSCDLTTSMWLPQSRNNRRKWSLVQTDATPRTTEDHKLLGQIGFMHQDTDDKKWTIKISNGMGSLAHWRLLQPNWTFDSLKPTRLLSRGAQSVSTFRRHLRCIVGQNKGLPRSKNKHKQFLFIFLNVYFGAFWRLVHVKGQPDLRNL